MRCSLLCHATRGLCCRCQEEGHQGVEAERGVLSAAHLAGQEAGPSLGEMGDELQEELGEIISNSKLSELYLALARDLDVMEPKLPEEVRSSVPLKLAAASRRTFSVRAYELWSDRLEGVCPVRLQVYKTHLVDVRAPSGPAVDSARQNLASTFVNAFVNAGFGQDKLMTGAAFLCALIACLLWPLHSSSCCCSPFPPELQLATNTLPCYLPWCALSSLMQLLRTLLA